MAPAAKSPSAVELKALFERKAALLRTQPQSALVQDRARVRLAYGLACEVEHDDRRMRVDAKPDDGGGATGPQPAQLMRASLGACLLMGYRIWAARLEVALDDASLEITCDSDARAELGMDPSAALGWTRLRLDVTLYSDAPAAELQRVIDAAHRTSPMLALLSPAIARELHVELRRSAGE
jgi:uncharacterized OsmC-like protein